MNDSRESGKRSVDPGAEGEHATEGVVPGADQPGENLASTLLPDDGIAYDVAADETEAEELDESRPDLDEDLVDDEEQLSEAEAVAAAAPSTRPLKRTRRPGAADTVAEADPLPAVVSARPVKKSAAVAKKDDATPRQARRRDAADGDRRVGPGQFLREVGEELRKVVWPTGSQLWQYFVVVLVFVLFIILVVSVLDLAFGWALLKLLG